ncbi:hypothetical protein F2Q69_00063479 [Brassica cretica]|uniref:D-isomer specific 2-hydroxyacid dehydrogenase NAD-binding domain-containing protein n=1 Tax=Brassica cretica TaxID=69181 RepID=A0A8S9RJK9_BRACR|nr:hypothetical protein F2Q69_00063479 [Brassica cretica]
MDELLSRNYRILNTHTSSDPLPVFLSRQASSVRAFVNIALLKIDADLLSHLPSLQLIVCTSVGTNHVDLAECKRRGISYNSTIQKQSITYPYYPDVLSLAANNDAIVLSCALNDQTRHIVNREVMESLGKNGVIINVGRGGLIDEMEMVKCLVEGVIGGAGLDVFEKEPGVPEELFGLDNVVLSPHAAMVTPGSLDNIAKLALANLKAFFSDQPLISPVRLD